MYSYNSKLLTLGLLTSLLVTTCPSYAMEQGQDICPGAGPYVRLVR